MQRKNFLVSATVAITILLIISATFGTSNKSSITWRKLFYGSAGMMGPYQAPLHGCDEPDEERVPRSYMVFLHIGYSLEQHKQVVGEGANLDSAIKFVFPETARHGLYYRSELDDDLLEAVRADLGVDMVECNRKVHVPETFGLGEGVE